MPLTDPAKPTRRRKLLILAYMTACAAAWLAVAAYFISPWLTVGVFTAGALATLTLITVALTTKR